MGSQASQISRLGLIPPAHGAEAARQRRGKKGHGVETKDRLRLCKTPV